MESIAVVTGGTRGLGRAISLALRADGCLDGLAQVVRTNVGSVFNTGATFHVSGGQYLA
jgi:hypothetical protein